MPCGYVRKGMKFRAMIRFRSEIQIIGINPYVLVENEQATQLKPGWRKPMPVKVRLNGGPEEPWTTNMMPVGDGRFYLYLHGEMREVSGTGVGDAVDVEVEFNLEYRSGPVDPMPDWFSEPLNAHSQAKAAWEALPPSRQKEILRYMGRLKSDEAKERNVRRAIEALGGSKIRFMARSWNEE